MAEEIVGLKIQVDGSDVGKSVGSLKQQLREAQGEVNALSEKFGATSKEAINAAKRAAELKDAIGDAKALTDAYNPDAKFKAFGAALQGVVGGFSAVQGAIGLFGVESKEVEQTLLKVQSAMALSQGLDSILEAKDSFANLGTQIKNSTAFVKLNELANKAAAGAMKIFGVAVETTSTSFKVLKGAIAATGIGLLVVAVGELVNAFQNYQSAAEKAKKAQDELNETVSKGAKIAFDTEVASIERNKQLDIAKAKNKGASEEEIFKIEQSANNRKIESQKRFIANQKALTVEQQIEQERDLLKQQNDIEVSELNFQTSQNQKKKEQSKKDKEEAATKKKEADAERKARKEQEYNDFVQFVNDRKAADDAELALQDFLISETKRKEQELFDFRVQIAQQRYDESEAEFAFLQELNKKKIDDEQKTFEARKSLQLAYIDVVANVAGLLNQVAGKNKALQSAAIIAENAAGIGRIVINTQVANAKAVAANPLALGQPWVTLNTINAGIGIASSILATRKALSELGGGGSAGTAPTLGVGGSAPLAPSEPTAQLTQLNQASINQMGSAAGRAYVVESDITNQQEKIVRINRAARLG
jgi:hypothetical protein